MSEDLDTMYTRCRALGIPSAAVKERMRSDGLSLDEAMNVVVAHRGKRCQPGGRGGNGGESFQQYFVDCLRVAMGKDPLYRQK